MKKILKTTIKKIIKSIFLYFLPSKKNDVFSCEEAENILQKHSPDICSSPVCNNGIHEKRFDLTVIVPIYNVEKYLNMCLDSLRNQKTKYSYHVVAVNDGATDRSGDILNAYTEWPDLMIINQKNKGISGARNTGLQYVFGKYIMFVDSDDYLPENTIESLLQAAYLQNADIVQGGFSNISENGQKKLGDVKYSQSSNVPPNGVLAGMPWGKVYKAELFSEICFPEGYWYEDSIITGIVTHMAKNIVTISDMVYNYRINTSGITITSKGKPRSVETLYVLRSTLKARKQLGMKTDLAFYEHLLRIVPLCFQRTKYEPEIVQRSIFVLIKKLLEEERGDCGFAVDRQYKMLESAILNGDFRRYRILCSVQ